MSNADSFTQVTFHYINGTSETFDIPIGPEAFQQQLQDFFSQPWLIMHLFDKTVFICTAQVIKVEVKPPLPEIAGQGVFPDAQLVTALTSGVRQ